MVLAECSGAELVELRPGLLACLSAAFGDRLDSHGYQQCGRRRARIPRIAKYRMQSLVS
jgi:hypothetical protein